MFAAQLTNAVILYKLNNLVLQGISRLDLHTFIQNILYEICYFVFISKKKIKSCLAFSNVIFFIVIKHFLYRAGQWSLSTTFQAIISCNLVRRLEYAIYTGMVIFGRISIFVQKTWCK